MATPIEVPTLQRPQDLTRVIAEYAQDAVDELRTPSDSFDRTDHQWVVEHAATSLAEIEKATLRRVALRSSETLSHPAARLGMSVVSLSRWFERRQRCAGHGEG